MVLYGCIWQELVYALHIMQPYKCPTIVICNERIHLCQISWEVSWGKLLVLVNNFQVCVWRVSLPQQWYCMQLRLYKCSTIVICNERIHLFQISWGVSHSGRKWRKLICKSVSGGLFCRNKAHKTSTIHMFYSCHSAYNEGYISLYERGV